MLQHKLDKIDVEIAKGLKLRAADRLRNLWGHYPDEIIIAHKLAELYYESGFLDAAGKYWILTEPKEERIRRCVEIYEKSVNYSGNQILKELVYRGDKSKLSAYAQRKLAALELDSQKVTGSIPKYTRKHFSSQKKQPGPQRSLIQKIRDKLLLGCFVAVLLLFVLVFIEGIRSFWILLFG